MAFESDDEWEADDARSVGAHYRDGRAEVYCGDCLDVLPELPDDSVDLILTDPPYMNVKDDAWDRQWKRPADFLAWLDRVLVQFHRVLRPNGSLYVFASPRMSARVEVLVGGRFEVLNHIVWNKMSDYAPGDARATAYRKREHEAFRRFFDYSERVIFAGHHDSDNRAKGEAGYEAKCDDLRGFVFEPLRAYLDAERESAGFSRKDCEVALGNQMSGHYFSRVQWELPTLKNYQKLQTAFNHEREYSLLTREYESLRLEYESLRLEYESLRLEYESLRRPFTVSAEVPYTDVWDYRTVRAAPGKHPCEKPLEMMDHVVRASSRVGGVVLDAFCGSGVVGEAAVRSGRRFVGIEQDERWCGRTAERLRGCQ